MSKCTDSRRSEQKLDACNAFFGERHCRIITFEDDSAGDQDGSEFELNAINENYEEKKYLVWITTDALTGAPTPAQGVELLAVEYVADETASEISAKFKAALDALDPLHFSVEIENGIAHVLNLFLGKIEAESYVNAGAISMEVGKLGFGGSLGAFASGGASLSTEIIVEQIFADQTAEVLLDEIIKGMTISLEVTLAEMTKQRWEDLIGNVSGNIVEIGQEKIVGYGTGKLFQSKFKFAGMLVLHPIALPSSDRSSDYVIHRTAPDMSSINFSGNEVQGAEFTFNAYQDKSITSAVDLFSKGDYTLL